MKRKENDLKQTSRELCSMLIFRGVSFYISYGLKHNRWIISHHYWIFGNPHSVFFIQESAGNLWISSQGDAKAKAQQDASTSGVAVAREK